MIKQDPYINKLIFSEYLIQKKIGRGSFGTVYEGIIVATNEKIAVKLEKRDKEKKDSGLLETEACRLYIMKGEGIPKIICYGNNQTHNILIQELLGHSLEELFNINGRRFSLKTVCSIGIEMIKRIKFVHSKYHIHRDIKPDNFMTGREKTDDKIYIIDFGLAKKYYSFSKKQHIKFKTGKNLIGTARYCGKNAHRGYEQGRRDDIESIGYVLMYFLNGRLPWQGLKVKKKEDQFQQIAEKKYHTTFEELTAGQPEEFLLYFKHSDSLNFEDEPNYDYLISLFNSIINKYCMDCLYNYDWKKNIIPNLSAIKNKEENNNNAKDISLLVNNNVSAIESKGEKEDNIKNKKDLFVGEDNNNNLKRNKSSNILINSHLIKEKLDAKNESIDMKNKLKSDVKNNNIFFLNNSITPQIQNININISFNNNLKQSKKYNKEDIFNKSDINIKKNLFNNLYNNEKGKKENNYNSNIFNKKSIKKEYFFSYDQNMDDMVKSNKKLVKDKGMELDGEKQNKLEDKCENEKLSRFNKPQKLDNIFSEDDEQIEEISDINDENDNTQIKNSFNNKEINHNSNKQYHNKKENKYENNKYDKNKELYHKKSINDNNIRLKKHKIIDNNDNDSINRVKKQKLNTSSNNKEINKSFTNNNENKKVENISKSNDINELKKKRRNRVKSADNKIRKKEDGCHCLIY